MFRRLRLSLLRLHRLILGNPRLSLALGLAVAAAAVIPAGHLRFLVNIDDLVDHDFSTYPDLVRLHDSFGAQNSLSILLASPNGTEPPSSAAACAFRDWVTDVSLSNFGIERSFSVFSLRLPAYTPGKLLYPRLLEPDCASQKPIDVSSVARSPWSGIYYSGQRPDLAAEFSLAGSPGGQFGGFDPERVDRLMKDLSSRVESRFPGLKSYWTGDAVYQLYMKRGYAQTAILNGAVVALILAAFRWLFGTWLSGLLFLGTVGWASTCLNGLMGLFGVPIDILSNSLVLMLILASLEDFMYLSYTQLIDSAPGTRQAGHWKKTFRKFLAPGFFTSLTSIVGFGSLATSDLGIIRRFGEWAAVAAALEWVAVFLLLPAFLRLLPRYSVWTQPARARGLRFAGKLAGLRLPRLAALACLALFGFAGWGATRLHVSDSPTAVFPSDHPSWQVIHHLEESRGWLAQISLIFPNLSDSKLSRPERRRLLESISHDAIVTRIEDLDRVERRLIEGLPKEPARLVKNDWIGTPSYNRLVAKDGTERALLYVNSLDIGDINRLRSRVAATCPSGECRLAGSLISYGEFSDRVVHTLLSSLAISLVLVVLILVWISRGLRHRALGPASGAATGWMIASALWGTAATLALLAGLQIPVYFVTCIFASVLVGLAGDNTIQYLFAAERKDLGAGIENRGGASVLVSLVITGMALVFLGSYFAPVRRLGLLLAGGFALSLLGDLWLLKGLLSLGRTSRPPQTQFPVRSAS